MMVPQSRFPANDDVRPDYGSPPAAMNRRVSDAITIGLVNNMPDAALAPTEAQFRRLIAAAAGDRQVCLKLFSLPGIARSDAARDYMRGAYESTAVLPSAGVDALIVTGAEPVAAQLRDEPYWSSLTALVDWAETGTVSTIWSCLAAHAAVLHLDGIRRKPLPAKCSGVFHVTKTERHPLLSGAVGPLLTPHSRLNALDEADLAAKGYRVLTRSQEIGVDAFVRKGQSLFVFFQGHPEYDADSLAQEYRRDVRRFLKGERGMLPAVPSGYFDPRVEAALTTLATRAAHEPRTSILLECSKIIAARPPVARWMGSTTRLYCNWLDMIAAGVHARNRSVTA
jgi:homoserine O-succinyltransferase